MSLNRVPEKKRVPQKRRPEKNCVLQTGVRKNISGPNLETNAERRVAAEYSSRFSKRVLSRAGIELYKTHRFLFFCEV